MKTIVGCFVFLLKLGIDILCIIVDLVGVVLVSLGFVIETLGRCYRESRKKKGSSA